MENPFEEVCERLARMESLLEEQNAKKSERVEEKPSLRYIPINEIIGTYCCKTTFYKYVRKGLFTIHKLEGKSFVDKEEFEGAFQKMEVE